MGTGPKWPKSGPETEKRLAERPNDHLPENQSYPELHQDMGISGTYDPIELGPFEPKNGGQHKNVAFWVSSHEINKKLDHFRKKWIFGQKLHFLPKILHFLRYTYETPIFQLGRT